MYYGVVPEKPLYKYRDIYEKIDASYKNNKRIEDKLLVMCGIEPEYRKQFNELIAKDPDADWILQYK